MTDLTYIALIVCLLASNVGRLWRLLSWIRSLLHRPLEPQLIPYFDEQGNLIGLVRVPVGFNERNARLPAYTHPRDQALDTNISVARRSGTEYSDHETKSLPRVAFDSTEGKLDSTGWNCWPDGNFERMFDWDEIFKTHGLATNWVVETLGHRGSRLSLTWQKGHETRHRCLGAITCHDRNCQMSLESSSRAIDRHRQIEHECAVCGESLGHQACGVESSLFRFQRGGYFLHRGFHNHLKFTHSSISQPDGSLVFVEYNAKYTISEEPAPDSSGDEETSDHEEWLGIGSQNDWPGIRSTSKGSVHKFSFTAAHEEPTEQSTNSEDSFDADVQQQSAKSEISLEAAESQDSEFVFDNLSNTDELEDRFDFPMEL
ncbi:hypothetical protein K438DRAFT_1774262 [Mycena galopus ATCC 62051]|nr:hypothetical protein K438DRAFT_1774262 [Mycena galopus ATCC 62051]